MSSASDLENAQRSATATPVTAHLADLLRGENESLNVLETVGGNEPFAFSAATSGADINIGIPGAAGDHLERLRVRNADGSNAATCVLKEGGNTIETFTVAANGVVDLEYRAKSVTGGWKINVTKAGTVSQVTGVAIANLTM